MDQFLSHISIKDIDKEKAYQYIESYFPNRKRKLHFDKRIMPSEADSGPISSYTDIENSVTLPPYVWKWERKEKIKIFDYYSGWNLLSLG
jgi:hypothetical protein